MSSSSVQKLVCIVFIMCMVADTAHGGGGQAKAITTCFRVAQNMRPCVPYINGVRSAPTAACCGRVKALNRYELNTKPKRQRVCNCVKAYASRAPDAGIRRANMLPAKCGLSSLLKLTRKMDCTRVK